MKKDGVIRFQAQVYKVQTLADGGIRITLDLPENAITTMADLAKCRVRGAMLEMAVVPIDPSKKDSDAKKAEADQDKSPKRRQRYPHYA